MELKLTESTKEIFDKKTLQINALKQRIKELEQEQIDIIIVLTNDKGFKNAKVENGILTWESSVKEDKKER